MIYKVYPHAGPKHETRWARYECPECHYRHVIVDLSLEHDATVLCMGHIGRSFVMEVDDWGGDWS